MPPGLFQVDDISLGIRSADQPALLQLILATPKIRLAFFSLDWPAKNLLDRSGTLVRTEQLILFTRFARQGLYLCRRAD